MKNKMVLHGSLAGLLLLLAATAAMANEPGAAAGQFLMLAPSARGAAMGTALTASATDIDALWWNPAGLGRSLGGQLQFVHAPWFEDITYNYLAYLHNQPYYGGKLGASLTFADYGDINITRIDGQAPVTGLGTTGANDFAVTLGYGRAEAQIDWGVNVKYIHGNLASHDASAWALDFGLRRDGVLFPGLSLGLALRNVGTRLEYVNKGCELPMTFTLGAAYKVDAYPLQFYADLVVPRDDRAFGNYGLEWRPVPLLALRAGYSDDNDAGNGLSCGFGVDLNEEFSFDYAFVPYGDLGNAHRIAVSYQFDAVEQPQLATGSEEPLSPWRPRPEPMQNPEPVTVPPDLYPEQNRPGSWPGYGPVVPDHPPTLGPVPAAAAPQVYQPAAAPATPPRTSAVAGPSQESPTGEEATLSGNRPDRPVTSAAVPASSSARSANEFLLAGHEFYGRHEYHLAARAYEEALRLEPGNAVALFNLGTTQYQLGDLRAAASRFERLTRVADHDAEAFAWLGVCRYYLNERGAATAAFNAAQRLDPGNELAKRYLNAR